MSRFFALVAALLLWAVGPTLAFAQEASLTAAAFPDTLGLPELAITQTEDGFAGLPEETEAGRYLVNFTGSAPEAVVTFVQLPEGIVPDDFAPAAPVATPTEDGAPPAPPEWLYDAYIAGGVGVIAPGQTGQAIVDLLPGEYAAWNEDFEAPFAVPFTVTGEQPADLPEPDADVSVVERTTEEGYDFDLTGEPAAGPATVRVVNGSDQPHHVVFIKSPVALDEERVMQLLMLDPASGATPPPGLPGLEEFTFPLYVPVQSAGSTQWQALTLEPGFYAAVCFVEDPTKGNVPHAFEGMIETFEVAAV